MNLSPSIETYSTLSFGTLAAIGSYFILRIDWKRYGLLYLLSGSVAYVICLLFTSLGFYYFPYHLFTFTQMPILLIFTVIPFIVLFGVRHSPQSWPWKIPFYWVIVHLFTFTEILFHRYTQVINYSAIWGAWDTYTWYWIYFLVMEWVGGIIIPAHLRKPLNHKTLHYGRFGFFIVHFVLITTIFMAGVYLGLSLRK